MSGLTRRRKPRRAGRHISAISGQAPALQAPEDEVSIADDLAALEAADAAALEADDAAAPSADPETGIPPVLPRRTPYAGTDPREEIARYLDAPEKPGIAEVQRLLSELQAWDPNAPAAIAGRPALPSPTRPQPALKPEPAPDPVPGAAVLLALGGTRGNATARLDGMPDRRTVKGHPVIHLGDDPENPGEAFAIGSVSDAWLDALIAVATEEKQARVAASAAPGPTFTPHARAETGAMAVAGDL